jgi:hypothetical protein
VGQALGQGEVKVRSIPGLARGFPSTYVRPRETRNKWPRRRWNAPGPGTEEHSFDARETVPPLPSSGGHPCWLFWCLDRRGRMDTEDRELEPFESIPDLLILAAVDRAMRHGTPEGMDRGRRRTPRL